METEFFGFLVSETAFLEWRFLETAFFEGRFLKPGLQKKKRRKAMFPQLSLFKPWNSAPKVVETVFSFSVRIPGFRTVFFECRFLETAFFEFLVSETAFFEWRFLETAGEGAPEAAEAEGAEAEGAEAETSGGGEGGGGGGTLWKPRFFPSIV